MKYFNIILSVMVVVVVVLGIIYFTGSGTPEAEELHSLEGESAHEHDDEENSDEIVINLEVMAEADIQIAPVSKRKFRLIKTYPGKIVARPDGEALVGSLVGGRVVEIPVGLGDRVSKGIALCRIESPEIGSAQSAYIRALAEDNLAQKDLIRNQTLIAEKIVSEKILLEKEATAQSARAEFTAAERSLYSIGFSKSEVEALMSDHSNSGILTLKSPIAGTVTDWSIRLGQRVEPNSDLFHIVDLLRMWVKISLYEKDLAYIRIGQSVEVIPQYLPGNTFQGKIVRIGREVKGETRTIDCYVEVVNQDEILIPNLFVTCRVLVGKDTDDEVLAVPEDAVFMDQHGDLAVYLEHEPQHFVLTEVETGRSSGGWVEVVDGLKAGDRVVFKGAFFIKSEVAKGAFGHGHAH